MTKSSRNAHRPSRVSKSSKASGSKTKSTARRDSQAGALKAPSKQQKLAALVVRDAGATLDQMIAATGWLPHTARAALTGLKKKGYVISSDKVDGVRTYRAVEPE